VKPFSTDIKNVLFPGDDSSDDLPEEEESENEGLIEPSRAQNPGKRPVKQIPNSPESDDEMEGEDRAPEPRIPRHPVQKTGAFTDLIRIRQISDGEFQKYTTNQKKQISLAIKVGAYLGGYFFQEILVDIGADCNLIDLHTAKKIFEVTEGCQLRTD
jgi:hypothetical protein